MHTLPVLNAQITEKAKLTAMQSMFPHNRSLRAVTDDVNLNIIEVTVSQDYNDLYNKPIVNGTNRLDAAYDIYVASNKLAKENQIPSLDPYRTAAAQDIIDNGKQAVITDLETIRSGASSGATALQPSALSPYRTSAAQDIIDSGKADTSDIPTAVSELTNDSGYLTLQTLPIWGGA